MPILRRHKYILLALGIYWPLIFWLTHMEVPMVARRSGMSDKTMHVLAYLALTFLLWLAVSPYEKVRWNRPKTWGVFLTAICYGILDEVLQTRIGRSGDPIDFMANLIGIVIGIALLSTVSFWPALLTVSAIFIFTVSNLSSITLLFPEYHLNTIFHFTAYTVLTLIWIQYDSQWRRPTNSIRCFLLYIVPPLGFLLFVKGMGFYFQKDFWWIDLATATAGITAAALCSWVILQKKIHRKSKI